MRFAGTRIEGFMDKERPDFGEMVQDASTINTKESNAYNKIGSKVGVSGIDANATAEVGRLNAEAQEAMAEGAAQGAMAETIGGIGSSLIGSFGGGGGSGGGFGGYSSGNYGFSTGIDIGQPKFNPNLF